MKSITIKGSKREIVGKLSTKALRNADKVPCVLYGRQNPIHFSANELDFSKLVYTPNAHTVIINLEGGEKINAILQDIQFHPVSDKILHVDFYQIFDDKPVTMEIPVIFDGSAPGVLMSGGVLSINMRKLKVKAIPSNLPDFIKANISELELGDKLLIKELKSSDYIILHPDNTVVCKVRTSRASIEVEDLVDETTEDSDEGEVEETKSSAPAE